MAKRNNLPVEKASQQISQLDGARAYAILRKQVTEAGILDRDYRYYAALSIAVFAGLAASIYFAIVSKTAPAQIVSGFSVAFFLVQVAGLMHDCVHRSIFKTAKVNDFIGYIVSSVAGIAYNDWKSNHIRHHARPNEVDEDPDINLPLLSFSQEKYNQKKGLAKVLRKYQAYLYFPMGFLAAFTIRLGNIAFFKKNFKRNILWQILIYAAGLFVWFVMPFLIFDFTKALILFIVTNSTAGVYLFNIFAPNHKGMPEITKGSRFSFLEQQIITTRNITPHPVTDIVYLGLNYQIEHHLFPECPRNKLKLITPYLKEVCKRMKLTHTEVGIISSNKMIINELKQIALTE